MLICPVCRRPLARVAGAYGCKRGHSFDVSSQGYVNLLLPNQRAGRDRGDNADMVRARTRFLGAGFYAPLCQSLAEELGRAPARRPGGPVLLDAGCGEGYYAARLLEALGAPPSPGPTLYGIDLSRHGLRHAARACPGGVFAVASLFAMPVADGSVDGVYSVFSPLCPAEFARVLAPGGRLVVVGPGPRHLYELKQVLYERPYENPLEPCEMEGFALAGRRRLTFGMALEGRELIQSLFMMTPYFYKTPRAGAARLEKLERLETQADFWVLAYQKRGAGKKGK